MRRRWLAVAAALLCLALVLAPSANPLVAWAERHNREVALAAGAAYVSLRAINATLSMAGEVEVGAGAIVGGSVAPLRWLEPVDDTVERVSGLIFAVAALSGLLSLSLAPISAIGFALMAIGLAGREGCRARLLPDRAGHVAESFLGCTRLGVTLALLLPAVFALGAWAGAILTRADWAEASAVIEGLATEARALIDMEGTWRDNYQRLASAAGLFWDQADDFLAAALTLAGIFVLRLVVLPAALLWAGLALMRRLI